METRKNAMAIPVTQLNTRYSAKIPVTQLKGPKENWEEQKGDEYWEHSGTPKGSKNQRMGLDGDMQAAEICKQKNEFELRHRVCKQQSRL